MTATMGSALALATGAAVVAVSPLMSLTTVHVTGVDRLDAASVTAALYRHLGTPLALLDADQIEQDLAEFSIIRSYSTEIVPPHTVIVRIVERRPVGAVDSASGWHLVDEAGVVVETTQEQPEGIPIIQVSEVSAEAPAFRSVAAVLLSLPANLASRVELITASTRDDVRFTMVGTPHEVVWGSAEQSPRKARVLEAAIGATDQSVAWEYDLSAPENLVVRRL